MSSSCFLDCSSDYRRVLRSRRRVSGRGWRLYGSRTAAATLPRFAVVVAKRHVRSAVQRNRVRRVLREYFRQDLCRQLPVMDYLLQMTAQPPLPPDNARLREECRALFSALVKKPLKSL